MTDRTTIASPVPGKFHRRPAPGAEPYRVEGDRVQAGDIVGLVEVMKTFWELKAEGDGVVNAFLIEDGADVQGDQDVVVLGDDAASPTDSATS